MLQLTQSWSVHFLEKKKLINLDFFASRLPFPLTFLLILQNFFILSQKNNLGMKDPNAETTKD